jgi:ubiquinone biosynthesis protein
MLNKTWIPTPLIKDHERPKIPIVEKPPVIKFRSFQVGFNLAGLLFKILFLKMSGRLDAGKAGRLVADFCQHKGVLWIKLGQLFSMRSDILPEAFCDQLAKLQDHVVGFPSQLARKILRQELGVPLEEVFCEFDSLPCAAASIAQVHRAKLKKEKVWVAIKIRRPGVDQIFSKDMALINFLVRIMIRFSLVRHVRWDDFIWELKQVLTEELDYYYEASNQERMREKLEAHDIYVPKVFRQYCTQRILVMEFIEAVSMADYLYVSGTDPDRIGSWLKENKIDKEKVARQLLFSYLRQLLEDNLFHADMHPGNIFLLRDSKIALLDFGSVGSNERDLLRKYDAFLMALSCGLYAKAIDCFLMIPPELPTSDLTPVRQALQWGLHSWGTRCQIEELPYKEKSPSFIFDFMTQTMAKNGIAINWSFFKLIRGWGTVDTSLRELNPGSDALYLTREYSRERKKREFKDVLFQMPLNLIRLQNLLDYPAEVSERALYTGAAVRRMAQVFESTSGRVSRLLATGFSLVAKFNFLATLIVLFLVSQQHTALFKLSSGSVLGGFLLKLPVLDIQVWAIIFVFVMRSWLSSSRLTKRLRKND